MERDAFLKLWNDAWNEGLWAAAWSKSVEGLDAQQAAWQPAPDRHSIWQNVSHIIFWRQNELNRLAGRPPANEAQVAAGNFPRPKDVTPVAWNATLAELRRTQDDVARRIADPATSLERLQYLLPHDCYHMGQINYLRALQGLKAIE
ncbi:MAG: DinB family protein [Phycisphaerae bacterium]